MEYQYYLDGLGCPNCAAKMEVAIGKLQGIKSCTVSFVNKKLVLELEKDNTEETILPAVIKQIVAIEEEVKVTPYSQYKARQENACSSKSEHSHGENGCQGEHEHAHEEAGHSHDDETTPKGRILFAMGIVLFLLVIVTEKLKWSVSSNVLLIGYVVAYIMVAQDVLKKSIHNIFRGQVFDEFFLMSVATIGALLIGEYPEAIAVMVFYKIGEYFQDKAVDKARHSIQSLVNIKPDVANVVCEDGSIKTVKPEEVNLQAIIEVKPGERIPLDGILLEGETSLDVAAITGEAKPLDVEAGAELYSGAINLTGLIRMRVTKTFQNSTVSRIMDMVENASDKKSKTEQFITKFARIYTPIVVFAALALAVIPPIITRNGDWSFWIYKALSFLVVSCPCALVISIPLGFFGGIGVASKNGILVKGGNYLEALLNVNAIAFDKTGTLTLGNFQVVRVEPTESFTKEQVLAYAAYAEHKSNHPIAKSIMEANQQPIDPTRVQNYEEISGYGIQVVVAGLQEQLVTILAGNYKLMERFEIEYEKNQSASTNVYIAMNNKYVGCIAIADQIKPGAMEGLKALKQQGVEHTILLSGDNQAIVDEVSKTLDIEYAFGELLPDDKLSHVEELYKQNPDMKLAYVGDGINDAPVLARADVGIAMGGVGQDAAIEAADVVLMTDEIKHLADAIGIARYTKQIVTENIILALGIKLLILMLVVFGVVGMWMAVFADVGVALLAVLNSIRAYHYKLK